MQEELKEIQESIENIQRRSGLLGSGKGLKPFEVANITRKGPVGFRHPDRRYLLMAINDKMPLLCQRAIEIAEQEAKQIATQMIIQATEVLGEGNVRLPSDYS